MVLLVLFTTIPYTMSEGYKSFLAEGIRIGEITVIGLQINGYSYRVCI
jgi:hypothetical protein